MTACYGIDLLIAACAVLVPRRRICGPVEQRAADGENDFASVPANWPRGGLAGLPWEQVHMATTADLLDIYRARPYRRYSPRTYGDICIIGAHRERGAHGV